MRSKPVLVALAAWIAPRTAEAMDLSWEAPAGCPGAAEIRAEVTRIVGPKERRQVTVRAIARTDQRGWIVTLHTRAGEEEGERTLRGSSCVEVANAAIVVIALTIDPDVLTTPPPSPPPPLPPPPLPPPRPPPPAPPPSLPAPKPRSWRVVARAGAGASFATPPGAAPYVWLGGGGRLGRAALHAGAAFASETSAVAAALPSAGSTFWMASAFARACAAPLLARFELWGCAGVEIDRIAARGYGVTAPRSADIVWLAPRADIELAWVAQSWIRLVLPLEVSFPVDRPTFVLDGVGPVFRSAPVVARVTLGLELDF